jgi:hypothetical protein
LTAVEPESILAETIATLIGAGAAGARRRGNVGVTQDQRRDQTVGPGHGGGAPRVPRLLASRRLLLGAAAGAPALLGAACAAGGGAGGESAAPRTAASAPATVDFHTNQARRRTGAVGVR